MRGPYRRIKSKTQLDPRTHNEISNHHVHKVCTVDGCAKWATDKRVCYDHRVENERRQERNAHINRVANWGFVCACPPL